MFGLFGKKLPAISLLKFFCLRSLLIIPGNPLFCVCGWVLLKENLPEKGWNLLLRSAQGSLGDWQIQGALDRNSISSDPGQCHFTSTASVLLKSRKNLEGMGEECTMLLSNCSHALVKKLTHFPRTGAGEGDGIDM